MKAITIQQFGIPPLLTITTQHEPVTMNDEALVGVRAIAIGQIDKQILQGRTTILPPLIGGINIAGVISAIETYFADTDECAWTEGDRVIVNPIKLVNGIPQLFGLHTPGGYAEYIDVPFENLYKLPATISFTAATVALAKWTDTHLSAELAPTDLENLFHRFPQDMETLLTQYETEDSITTLSPEDFLGYTHDSEIANIMVLRWR